MLLIAIWFFSKFQNMHPFFLSSKPNLFCANIQKSCVEFHGKNRAFRTFSWKTRKSLPRTRRGTWMARRRCRQNSCPLFALRITGSNWEAQLVSQRIFLVNWFDVKLTLELKPQPHQHVPPIFRNFNPFCGFAWPPNPKLQAGYETQATPKSDCLS